MRPKNPLLRYAFRAAKAHLKLEDKKITIGSLAVEMGANFKTVQRFLYRDQAMALEIGVELEHIKHDLGEYTNAIVKIPSNERPTARRIGALLGLDHSSVSRFLKAHPELRALHPRFDPVTQEPAAEPEKSGTIGLRWRDLGISV